MKGSASRWILCWLALFCVLPAMAEAEGRHVAIIVDTSGSMTGNDPRRYTAQLSRILSDLVADDDALTVIRMPEKGWLAALGAALGGSQCDGRASSQLALNLDPADRKGFKQRLDSLIQFDTGTYFAAPIRTAIKALSRSPGQDRMLLIIADSGGLGKCRRQLTRELEDLHATGATIAAINLGRARGAFDTNPAFDFTTQALDATELVEAVALVYQKFLGTKKVQTGKVETSISFEIAPFVREAYLVVAADGPIESLAQAVGNPPAQAIDLNHRDGGQTRGLDGRYRGYRIAQMQRPEAGRWSFSVPKLQATAGWMLLQDSSVGARLRSSPVVPRGIATPLEIELYDQNTGKTISDPALFPGLELSLEIDGQGVPFRDDGKGGGRQAGDGVLTGLATFDSPGRKNLPIRLESDLLDRSIGLEAEVVDAAWQLTVLSPDRAEVDSPVTLQVALEPIGDRASLTPPERIEVTAGGLVLALRDDGQDPDQEARDDTFSGQWTPVELGSVDLDYVPIGGSAANRARAPIDVTSSLQFGPSATVDLGELKSSGEAQAKLDLTTTEVHGEVEVEVSTDFELDGAVLEIDLGRGWQPFDDRPRTVQLSPTSARHWPLRLRVGRCPAGHAPDRPFEILVAMRDSAKRVTVPLRVAVIKDPWLKCRWPLLALPAGLSLIAVIIHGFWSPSRFAPRLGVVLSPEEDMNEGFFHSIRGQRGSRSGFYRDARIYISPDYRLTNRPRGALARLRADGNLAYLQPVPGATLWRQSPDDAWERLPEAETRVHFGTIFRNDMKTLYFEIRNG